MTILLLEIPTFQLTLVCLVAGFVGLVHMEVVVDVESVVVVNLELGTHREAYTVDILLVGYVVVLVVWHRITGVEGGLKLNIGIRLPAALTDIIRSLQT